MKFNVYIGLFLISFLLLNCDRVKDPIIEKTSGNERIDQYYPGDPSTYQDSIVFPDNTNTNRNVLIEDYTGHLCNNCPPAAETAKTIEENNPGRVFALGVHAGGATNTFQQTPNDTYKIDYTTDFGTAYSVEIPGFFGNPQGMVSRVEKDGSLWLFQSEWESAANTLLTTNELKANIQIKTEYFEETGGIFVHYEVEALEDLDPEARVLILLAEKKVVSPQKMPDGTTNYNYEHHNVLSGKLSLGSSIWGERLSNTGLKSGEKIQGLAINGINEMNTRRTINADAGNDLMVFAIVLTADISTNNFEIYQVVTEDVPF